MLALALAAVLGSARVYFTLVHRYDFITGKWADIRRGDSWGWGFFHERLIHPYIHVLRGIFLFFFMSSCLPIYFLLFLYLSSHVFFI